jgi:hypothetical protein
MENATPRPDTINALRFGVDASFAMLAGMQLDVFTPLQHGAMSAEQIAAAIGIAPTRLPLLLYALVAAGLLTEQNGRFANTPEAQHFLVKDAPSYMGNLHAWIATSWKNNLKTAESLRTGVPQAHVDFSHSPPEEVEAVLRRISARTVATAAELLARYDFSAIQTLADVGGGGGGLALTLTRACPRLQATVVDLPQVTPITQKIVNESGATDRVKVLSADVVREPLPGAYEVAVLKSVLHVLSAKDAREVVQHVGGAINPGGTIYIIGQILDDSRTAPPEAVGANLAFINRFSSGESYTEHEHRVWLREAGFVDIERADFLLGDGFGLMTARKQG